MYVCVHVFVCVCMCVCERELIYLTLCTFLCCAPSRRRHLRDAFCETERGGWRFFR